MTDSERKRIYECEIAAGLQFLACIALLAAAGVVSLVQSVIAVVAA